MVDHQHTTKAHAVVVDHIIVYATIRQQFRACVIVGIVNPSESTKKGFLIAVGVENSCLNHAGSGRSPFDRMGEHSWNRRSSSGETRLGEVQTIEIGRLERRLVWLTAEGIGLMLVGDKRLLGKLARLILETQMEECATGASC